MAHSHSTKAWCVAIMCAITVITLTKWERFLIAGGELLNDPQFSQGLKEWDHFNSEIIVSDNGSVEVVYSVLQKPGDAQTSQYISDIGCFEYLKIEADIKTEQIIKGGFSSLAARIELMSYNAMGHAQLAIPHRLIRKSGDNGWCHYKRVFRVYEGVTKMRVIAGIHNATGKMWIRNISVAPVVENETYQTIRNLLMIPWAVLAVWILAGVTSSPGFGASYLVVIGVGIIVVTGIVFPKQMLLDFVTALDKQLLLFITEIKLNTWLLPGYLEAPDDYFSFAYYNRFIHKAAHFGLFMAIANITFRIHSSLSVSRRLLYLFLFATVAESLQLFTRGRQFGVNDIAINCVGVVAGLCVYLLVRKTAS